MKYQELLEVKIGDLNIGEFQVLVDKHALERAVDRFISPRAVDRTLKKIPSVAAEIEKINDYSLFYLVDTEEEISLGMKKINNNKLYFNTVVNTVQPYGRGIKDIITI